MKIRKRIISIMLTVFMLASVMPNLIVSAEEATSELQNIYYKLTVDKKAKIGYIGGSITQGYLATTPWPTLLGDWFGENFKDAEIENAKFDNANLKNATFENADLEETSLRNANIENTCFKNTELEYTIWTDGKVCDAESVGSCW